ncbi:macro domain-containing protein [Clostridium butyricum]|uniref:macro domain-containing protein n=1 Tax=Clostridium butyricum TaxID=1492 RepID=UPI00325BD644
MKINEQKGNLFELDKKYSLAHCISQDCAMGAGIAVAFDKNFRGMKNYCRRVIEVNNLTFPVFVPYCDKYRTIFNMVTKRVYYGKPTYGTISKCIKDMASMCKEFNIKHLGIPKIGCGLDRLQWGKVREIIEQEFKDIDIEIEVRYL